MAEQTSGQKVSMLRRAALWLGMKATQYGVGHKLTDEDAVTRLLGGGGTVAGIPVTQDTALQISTVWSCVRVLSETIGALPWAIYEKDRTGNAVKVDHPLAEILMGSPNADMTPQELREAKVVNLAMRGNAASIIDRGARGRVISVYPVPWSRVQPRRTPEGEIVYNVNDRGKWETLPAEKVWHLKGFGGDGLLGLSPLSYARQAMGLALATETFGAQFFRNGAVTTGIVKTNSWLKDEQRVRAQQILDEMWRGIANAGKVQLLEGGMDFETVTMPLEDAQFLATRKFQVNEICRIYRVPPHLVADLDRATFSNIEQMSQDFLQFTLMPYFKRFEETFSKRLLGPGERGRFFLRFNAEGLLRADSAARASLYSVLLQNGVYSRNEARALENMPRSDAPGMDDHTVQSNMALIQFLEAMGRSQTGASQ